MTFQIAELEDFVALAEQAARMAGQALRARASGWTEIAAVEGRDVKVAADSRAEEIILDVLSRESRLPVLSEERGWKGAAGDTAWIVDPLDGSANYVKGIPLSAVSIGVLDAGRPRAGVVYDFARDELFSGVVGKGASLDGAVMKVSDVSEPARAVLMTGLPARRAFDAASLEALAADFGRWRKVRMIGSAALALAYVAAGRADCYHEDDIMMWDVAAGLALVMAAGGSVEARLLSMQAPFTVTAHNGHLVYRPKS